MLRAHVRSLSFLMLQLDSRRAVDPDIVCHMLAKTNDYDNPVQLGRLFRAFWCPLKDPLSLTIQPASVAQLDWRPGGRGFDSRRGRQHSFAEI